MLVEKRAISTACKCHGCGKLSRFIKGGEGSLKVYAKSVGWEWRLEHRYGKRGIIRRGGFTENFYCRACVKKGVTAAEVAKRVS